MSTEITQLAHPEFRSHLFNTPRAAATNSARDVILLFRGVLDSSASGRRSAQIALESTVTTQEIALWR